MIIANGKLVVTRFFKIISVFLFIIGLIVGSSRGFSFIWILLVASFGLWPMLVNIGLAFWSKHRLTDWLILLSSVGYLQWFIRGYYDTFYVHPDPQSPIVIIYIGFYSMKFMAFIWMFFWISHFFLRYRAKNRKSGEEKV